LQVVQIGDYFQLPPTKGSPPYKAANTVKGKLGRAFIVEHFKLFSELTTPNFRQLKDPTLNALCTAARFCTEPSAELLRLSNERYTELGVAQKAVSPDALYTASTWAVVDNLNARNLEECRTTKKTIVNIFAK
jgi:hypothetical protein